MKKIVQPAPQKPGAGSAVAARKHKPAAAAPAGKADIESLPARRDAAATRARLLDVAIAEFSAKGCSGARIEAIARDAGVNIRMVYHYFGSKEALYITVLEHTLAQLRADELQLDFDGCTPLDGLMQLFDFIDGHFSAHPELMQLLSSENLNRAHFMQKSQRIPEMATPVLALLQKLLLRGERDGSVGAGIDALHLYVTFVSLAYFHKSNAHTLSRIFQTDLLGAGWQQEQKALNRRMLLQFLVPSSASTTMPETAGLQMSGAAAKVHPLRRRGERA